MNNYANIDSNILNAIDYIVNRTSAKVTNNIMGEMDNRGYFIRRSQVYTIFVIIMMIAIVYVIYRYYIYYYLPEKNNKTQKRKNKNKKKIRKFEKPEDVYLSLEPYEYTN